MVDKNRANKTGMVNFDKAYQEQDNKKDIDKTGNTPEVQEDNHIP